MNLLSTNMLSTNMLSTNMLSKHSVMCDKKLCHAENWVDVCHLLPQIHKFETAKNIDS